MNCDQFLSDLREALAGLPPQEIDDIVADYRAYFAEGQADGRSDDEVARALGDPARLAKDLRAQARMKRWQTSRTPSNFFRAAAAVLGVIAVDFIVMLPVLCILGLVVFVIGVVLFAFIVAGVAVLFSPVWGPTLDSWISVASVVLAGIGLISGGIGFGALTLIGLEGLLLLFSRYAQLHHQLVSRTA